MKKSNYNFSFTINKKNKKYTILFNSLYGSITLLPKSLQESFGDKKIIETLRKNRHLIDDNINEIDLIRSQNKLQRFNERTLELTILSTLWCNLNCIYCYEGNKKKKTMSDEDIEAIYNYICTKIKKINALSLLWFGGEPLLEIEKIRRLSKKLILLTQKNNVKFCNSIITNATLLDENNRKALSESGIKNMQVTLDGPPEVHDRRKPTLNGSGTFDTILNNLMYAVKQFDISVRINIDKTNINYVKDLIDILAWPRLTQNRI